ncbi:hypothetical protein [Niallia nealsonii]|uniref:Uncharacterized protein n=1 Tax=Niallia nealsonii TaxID=115979 RepID=A0A2N0Z600_9BACI|nr:hypothetical protein [Niallia nealsonii]PKG24914.1 hypothetical protein CWS01_04270 [Niallia nealsonii]
MKTIVLKKTGLNTRGIILITFLLILSITLNMLAFLFIALLYIRQNRFVTIEKQQKQIMKEMEEIISTFIAEVKEENDQFIRKITKVEGGKAKKGKEEENSTIPFKQPAEKNRGNLQKSLLNKQMVKAYNNTAQNTKNLEEDITENLLELIQPNAAEEKTLLDQAVDLQKQGKKIDEIAKILNKGKTEIELLLKFRQK